MGSLLPEVLYEESQQAAPPCKDYHQLIVTQTEVILNVWPVVCPLRQEKVQPSQNRKPHQHVLQDNIIQGLIGRVFGAHTLGHVLNLCQHRYDYLVRLPDKFIFKILYFLEWAEIKNISQVCKRLQQLCCSERLWAEGATGARYGQSSATMEGVSPRLQRHLLAYHRRQVLARIARQHLGKKSGIWHL